MIFLLLMMLTCLFVFGQDKYVPATLDDAIAFLEKDCPDSIKQRIKHVSPDSIIYVVYPYLGSYKRVAEWTMAGDSSQTIKKFFFSQNIRFPFNQQCAVWFAFGQTLRGVQNASERTLNYYQQLERKWAQEDSVRFTTDSLRGHYIPTDLRDCIVQIDKMLSDSVKEEIRRTKPGDFFGESHLNFGMYLRNSWQLWMGSRLTKYFNEIGIEHPDTMSGAILAAYYQSLTVKDFNVDDYKKRLAEKYGKYKKRKEAT
jgi:hypothetical protein